MQESLMQLTMFTDYALRSLMFIASHPDRLTSVREISEHYNISRNHLVKVIHKLALLEYITTTKGKGGGLAMAISPEQLRLGDLIQELEPNLHLVECFDKETNTCRIINTCRLKHCLMEANAAFIQTLNKYTLANIIRLDESRLAP
jgi:Rrf2 family transcriptional regulator, nitric oxide-sensitive transcriptional repressor